MWTNCKLVSSFCVEFLHKCLRLFNQARGRSDTPIASWSGLPHLQPLLSKYSTAQNTSYRSTIAHLVFLRVRPGKDWICSRPMPLGYCVFLVHLFLQCSKS